MFVILDPEPSILERTLPPTVKNLEIDPAICSFYLLRGL